MITDVASLLAGFSEGTRHAGIPMTETDIEHQLLQAPHTPPDLPRGRCGVYVFSLRLDYEREGLGNTVLKVGKVGPKSGPRFKYQHYNPKSADSTLAGSLLRSRVLWPYLGIGAIHERSVKDWLLSNTDRDHFFIPAALNASLGALEKYVRGVTGPVFEG